METVFSVCPPRRYITRITGQLQSGCCLVTDGKYMNVIRAKATQLPITTIEELFGGGVFCWVRPGAI
jgi:hypothetical protein